MLALVGPTGAGKTELACELARACDAEIVGADSMQVYRGMDIGTAKPSRALRDEIPHHAIDVTDPDDPMSAGRYAQLARSAAHEVLERGRRVILCGGSGLYARAFAGGLIDGPEADPALREELEKLDSATLHARLTARDPGAAARIHPSDRVRLVRALEVHTLSEHGISAQHAGHAFEDRPFEIAWMALDAERDTLSEALRARVAAMFEAGLVDEVRGLHAAGYGPELKALNAIGYREVGRLLAGEVDETLAREAVWVATRRYAKRQRTWFRAEPGLEWFAREELARRGRAFLEGG